MKQDILNVDIYFKIELKDAMVDMLLEDGYDDFFILVAKNMPQAHSLKVLRSKSAVGKSMVFLESYSLKKKLILLSINFFKLLVKMI